MDALTKMKTQEALDKLMKWLRGKQFKEASAEVMAFDEGERIALIKHRYGVGEPDDMMMCVTYCLYYFRKDCIEETFDAICFKLFSEWDEEKAVKAFEALTK
jgi:hypothetical protein